MVTHLKYECHHNEDNAISLKTRSLLTLLWIISWQAARQGRLATLVVNANRQSSGRSTGAEATVTQAEKTAQRCSRVQKACFPGHESGAPAGTCSSDQCENFERVLI